MKKNQNNIELGHKTLPILLLLNYHTPSHNAPGVLKNVRTFLKRILRII